MPLSDAKLRSLKPGPKPYKVSDGHGLHVLVTPAGGRLWRLSYRYNGKQKTVALGAYPVVGLLDARERALGARKRLEAGQDPSAGKSRHRAAGSTFGEVAAEWIARQKPTWVDSYASRMEARLEEDLIPPLGGRPLADIKPLDVLQAVQKVEARGAPEMARRIKQMAGQIFRYGVATGRCDRDPTADLRDALAPAPPAKRRAALHESDLPEFFRRLARYDGDPLTKLALMLVVQTFVRTGEVRFAHWSEFEGLTGSSPLWRIPPERMKMRREHLVPLSRQAVALLTMIRRHSGDSPVLFPADGKSGVISENTMIFAMYRLGYHSKATVHGFRSTASTVLNENSWNADWIEMQLAHVQGGVRGIYNAAKYLDGRRAMMQWWADFLDRKANDDIDDLL